MSVSFGSGVSLREIFPRATFLNADDVKVGSCSSTLTDCRAQDLFVALLDVETDGHEDAIQAVSRRGARAVLTERLLPIDVPQCIVPDSRIAFGQLCHAMASNPCRQINSIAVSGTDGKTSTAHLIQSIFEVAERNAILSSTLTRKVDQDAITQPFLATTFAEMVKEQTEFGIVETSSVQLAEHRFAGAEFDVVALNNLRGNHFHVHQDLANYRRAELRTFEYLKPGGVAVLNLDDPGCYFALNKISVPTMTVGIKQDADVTAKLLECDLSGTTFLITAGDLTATVKTAIPGVAHVSNCLVAAAVGLLQGIDLQTIVRGIERVTNLPGRMNVINCGQKFKLIVDQSQTAYRLGTALRTLRQQVTGKVYCVFGADQAMHEQQAAQLGRVFERMSNIPVLSQNCVSRTKSDGDGSQVIDIHDFEPLHRVLDGFDKPGKACVMPDRIQAVEWALQQAKPGDGVLVAGCGEQPIASLQKNRWQLTDTEVCQSWLYGESSPGQAPTLDVNPTILNIDDFRPC